MTNTKINKETLLPLGIVTAVVMAVASGAVWLNTKLQSIDYNMHRLGTEMKAMQTTLDDSKKDDWTFREMKLWAELLKAKNASLDVPSINR
tara:strand:- start:2962 stop:3234 length:273 start_codon:yes stop_codon:yes gene_type:complete